MDSDDHGSVPGFFSEPIASRHVAYTRPGVDVSFALKSCESEVATRNANLWTSV